MRVAVCDRSAIFREGLGGFLASLGHQVVLSAASTEELAELGPRTRPDVVVLDAAVGGHAALERLRRAFAGVSRPRVVLITASGEGDSTSALAGGLVDDVVWRTSDLHQLERVMRGLRPAPAAVIPAQRARRPVAVRPAVREALTPREREVLELMVDGHSTRDMASSLGISQHTVHTHVQGALRKFGVSTRLQAVHAFLAGGHTATVSVATR